MQFFRFLLYMLLLAVNALPALADPVKPRSIVFLITEDPDNYEAHKTIPVFAKMLREKHGYEVTILLGTGRHGAYRYPDMKPLAKADLLIVFARRIALPVEQMDAIKRYLEAGKPLVGIRTANHAFTPRDSIAPGFTGWPEFVSDVLGCENRGYGPVDPGMDVAVTTAGRDHAIVKGVERSWHSAGNIYLVAPLLDPGAVVILEGKVNENSQPVAWTRRYKKSKVFYTSLGFPADFSMTPFTRLLVNAIGWALATTD